MSLNARRVQRRQKLPAATCKKRHNEFVSFADIIKLANENIGLITFVCSSLVAILTGLAKAFIFAYERGVCRFWNIDSSCIDLSSGNILYNLLFYVAFVVCILFLNYAFYYSITFKAPSRTLNIIASIFIFLLTVALVAFTLFYPIVSSFESRIWTFSFIWRIALCSLLISFLLLIFSISFMLANRITKPIFRKRPATSTGRVKKPVSFAKNQITEFLLMVPVVAALCIMIPTPLLTDAGDTRTEDTYKTAEYKIIIETQKDNRAEISNETNLAENSTEAMVVLYEGNGCFIVSPCSFEPIENTLRGETLHIYYNYQTVIDRQGVSFVKMCFNDVIKEDSPVSTEADHALN